MIMVPNISLPLFSVPYKIVITDNTIAKRNRKKLLILFFNMGNPKKPFFNDAIKHFQD